MAPEVERQWYEIVPGMSEEWGIVVLLLIVFCVLLACSLCVYLLMKQRRRSKALEPRLPTSRRDSLSNFSASGAERHDNVMLLDAAESDAEEASTNAWKVAVQGSRQFAFGGEDSEEDVEWVDSAGSGRQVVFEQQVELQVVPRKNSNSDDEKHDNKTDGTNA